MYVIHCITKKKQCFSLARFFGDTPDCWIIFRTVSKSFGKWRCHSTKIDYYRLTIQLRTLWKHFVFLGQFTHTHTHTRRTCAPLPRTLFVAFVLMFIFKMNWKPPSITNLAFSVKSSSVPRKRRAEPYDLQFGKFESFQYTLSNVLQCLADTKSAALLVPVELPVYR